MTIIGIGGVGSFLAIFTTLERRFDCSANEHLYLFDSDIVQERNYRGFFFEEDIGKNKAICIREKIKKLRPELNCLAFPNFDFKIQLENFPGHNPVFDCTDDIKFYNKFSEVYGGYPYISIQKLSCDADDEKSVYLQTISATNEGRIFDTKPQQRGYAHTPGFGSNALIALLGTIFCPIKQISKLTIREIETGINALDTAKNQKGETIESKI